VSWVVVGTEPYDGSWLQSIRCVVDDEPANASIPSGSVTGTPLDDTLGSHGTPLTKELRVLKCGSVDFQGWAVKPLRVEISYGGNFRSPGSKPRCKEKEMSPDKIKALKDAAPTVWVGDRFDCGDGWFGILLGLSSTLAQLEVSVSGVKEKYAGLDWYVSNPNPPYGPPEVGALLLEARNQSLVTCEICGGPGKVCANQNEWEQTLCPKHCNEKGYNYPWAEGEEKVRRLVDAACDLLRKSTNRTGSAERNALRDYDPNWETR